MNNPKNFRNSSFPPSTSIELFARRSEIAATFFKPANTSLSVCWSVITFTSALESGILLNSATPFRICIVYVSLLSVNLNSYFFVISTDLSALRFTEVTSLLLSLVWPVIVQT